MITKTDVWREWLKGKSVTQIEDDLKIDIMVSETTTISALLDDLHDGKFTIRERE